MKSASRSKSEVRSVLDLRVCFLADMWLNGSVSEGEQFSSSAVFAISQGYKPRFVV